MTGAKELLSSMDAPWKVFTRTWKKARAKTSEKSIHDLRISTRRLIAALDVMRAASQSKDLDRVRRRLKKILKWTSSLRDLQVQLRNISNIRQSDLRGFQQALERREKREM